MNEEEKKDGLEIAEKAEEMELNGNYYEASEKYKEAGKIFKECKRDDLFARCLVAQYANLVKYDWEGRLIEVLADNLTENYLKKIENELKQTSLDDFNKYNTLISAYREIEKIFDKANEKEKANEVYFKRTKLHRKYYWFRRRNRNTLKKNKKKQRKKKLRDWLRENLKIRWLNARDIFSSIMSWFFHLYCGYGERPLRALFISIVSIFSFAGIFYYFKLIEYSSSASKPICFLQSVYFTLATFTTVGYGDIIPKTDVAQFLAIIGIGLGYFMLGALVAIIIRKITR